MNVTILGGTGQIGTLLARALTAQGHGVTVVSRRPVAAPWKMVGWDGVSLGDWTAALEGIDAVINLAGRSVNCRYTAKNRQEMIDSRVRPTEVLGRAIAGCRRPPRVWLQASTATIYAHRYDADNDEATGILGGHEPTAPNAWRFSIEVAKAWEAAAQRVATPQTRKVLLRTAMTMSADRGGVFDTLLGLVRRGLGGTTGDGRQYMSWIHEDDFVAAVGFLIAEQNLAGAVNLSAPQPLPNADFMRALRQAWGIRFGLPASVAMLEIATLAMRTESELVLKSRRVVPGRLLAVGFRFQFPAWPAAAADLCERWRAAAQNRVANGHAGRSGGAAKLH
ncbi:MAG TPA: TIGR01777 family oxidoreductase, partial [Pirellulales bacterium]